MKFAIFKNKVGLHSALYVDEPKDLKDFPYISEDRLPVIINNCGGYTSFNVKYYPNFVEIREVDEDEEPLTREERYPKNSKDFEYGWIDPEGNTYNTGYENHCSGARAICKELGYESYSWETKLEEKGYIKITKDVLNNSGRYVLAPNFFITKKQADTLFDIGLYDNDEVQRLVHVSERKW